MGKKVLVVDDSATVRQQVRMVLEQAGFTVAEAVDGQDAVVKVNADTYDGVVCDVNMPRMNGVEFVEKVKADAKHAALPILMLTTEGAPDLIRRAKAAGVKGWIVKPFKADQVVAAITKLTT
jgi:two-component system, chemotaxis family, chemotaxis protein CheY